MATTTLSHATEVREGERFEFGENWRRFLRGLTEERILQAEQALREHLQVEDLAERTFLDVGSGSGLFSLAARRLGARVTSFDYDPQSVACTREMRARYFPDDPTWSVEEGSVLDRAYLQGLGQHDVVYSWGVLHHTGSMRQALDNVTSLVRPGGKLAIAIYNDTGANARLWLKIKRTYNALPHSLRFLVLWPAFARLWGPTFVRDLLRGAPLRSWKNYSSVRGMSAWRDVVDWVGGYPYEFASVEAITQFYAERRFDLRWLRRVNGNGCNEFLFESVSSD